MVFIASILFAASCVLPSAMGLTLNTPTNTAEAGNLLVTWTPAATDPTFAILLKGPISIDVATGVKPALGNTTVALGQIPPGTYTVEAVTGDAIGTVLSTSQPFQITPEGAVAAAAPAAAAPAAAAPAVAAPATAAPATAAPAKGNTAKTGKKGKGAKAGKAAKGRKGAKKGPRMVPGAFGRRELYRD
ncbi:hypothetical protein C8R45DRAFT_1099396 [Mycena sanguinolenta]|nr:hypothetical protein C8R45DRAFT_1099396 [Mycena sanguinolenta]